MDQAGEEQDHIPSLVHDRAMAERAAHFTRQLVLHALLRRIVPLQIVVSVLEVYILLVEDGRPLERRRVLRLARPAVAELAVQWLFAIQLVRDTAAVATGFVDGFEVVFFCVNTVWSALLPFFHAFLVAFDFLAHDSA